MNLNISFSILQKFGKNYFKWACYSSVLIQPCNSCFMSLGKFEVTLPLRGSHIWPNESTLGWGPLFRKEIFVKVSPTLNINWIKCVYIGLTHLIKTVLSHGVGEKVGLLQTQKPRRHLGAWLVRTEWQRLDRGRNQGFLSLSFPLASNSVPYTKGKGPQPHFVDAKANARRGDFPWEYEYNPPPMFNPVS